MLNFAMYCKTYRNDLQRVWRMISSFNTHNVEKIEMFLSVPENDISFFESFSSTTVHLVTDESYGGQYFSKREYHGLGVGYINQEICKLSFWESRRTENYLCIDADVEFIRDFYHSDFMADTETPYTVLVMDKDLSVEKHYRDFWKQRQSYIQRIFDFVGLDDRRLRTCHGMQVLSGMVLQSLKDDFMSVKGLSYEDLIAYSPYEFTWYNAWFQKIGIVDEIAVEPFFKTFHMRIEYVVSRLKMIRREDFSISYVGIILNSNWKKTEIEYHPPCWIHKIGYKILRRL